VTDDSPADNDPTGGIGLVDGERYELRGLIGRGGGGQVHRALDRELGHEVALKSVDDLGPRELFRLKREFRLLQDLHHRNVVHYHELAVDGRRCFFTMELVPGQLVLEHIWGPEPPWEDESQPPPERVARDAASQGRLRSCVEQLLLALHTLHAAEIVHRDLKPGNILVADDGRVVLIDFGLALADGSSLGVDGLPSAHSIEGTPLYMAPEQVHGQEPTPAVDLYSVGVLIHQALVGRPPFSGPPSLVFHAKTHRAAEPVLALAPDADPQLARLADALLAGEPGARPDATEALAVLRGPPATAAGPRFLGRLRELARLDAEHRAVAAHGAPRIVTVVGPSGIGKSALVERFLQAVGRDGNSVVLRGRCHPQKSVEHNALDGVVDDLSSQLAADAAPLQGLDVADLAALARAFPVLQRVPSLRDCPAPADPPQEARRRLGRALRAVISAVAAERPVVVSIDDAQWADRASVAPLLTLLGPDAPPVLLVCTVRDDTEPGLLLGPL